MLDALEPTPDPGWVLGHEGYNVLTESAVESRFALGNGFLGMRAARSVSRGPTWLSWLGYIRWASWPRCYVAGLFDIPNTEPPVPALVPVADWSRVRVLLDGEPLLAREGEMLAGTRRLDLRRGVLLVELDASHPRRDHRHRTRAAPAVAGGLRGGAAAPAVLAGPRRRRGDAGGQLRDGRLGHGADAAGRRTSAPGARRAPARAWRWRAPRRCVCGDAPLAPDRPFPLRWAWHWRSEAGQVAELDRLVAVARADTREDDPAPPAA